MQIVDINTEDSMPVNRCKISNRIPRIEFWSNRCLDRLTSCVKTILDIASNNDKQHSIFIFQNTRVSVRTSQMSHNSKSDELHGILVNEAIKSLALETITASS